MVFDKVIQIVASELNVSKDEITMETDLQSDLGADSLDAVELMMAIEDEFELQIPDDIAQDMKTIKDIVLFLESNN